MITVYQTAIVAKPQQNFSIALQSIYGLGPSRSEDLMLKLTGRFVNPIKLFKLCHYRWLTQNLTEQCLQSAVLLKEKLQYVKRLNIVRLKLLKCYRGIRHMKYLPVHGQRTKSNAITARYLGSGSFNFIPSQPNNKIKKISSYVRHDVQLKQASDSQYNKLLAQNFQKYKKENLKTFSFLAKKNQLGIFSKFTKVKKLPKVKKKDVKKPINKKK